MLNKEFEEIKNIVAVHFGALGFLNPSENEQILKDRDKVLNALTELKQIKEAKPSEAMECLERVNPHLETDLDRGVWNKQHNVIKQALLKAQELGKELADVEKVKSGKIIIYFGKDLVMMNKNKYYDYLELEKEPISKRILQAKCEELEKENTELNQHIKRWHDLLLKTGINSKGTVVDEIENYWTIKVEAKNER